MSTLYRQNFCSYLSYGADEEFACRRSRPSDGKKKHVHFSFFFFFSLAVLVLKCSLVFSVCSFCNLKTMWEGYLIWFAFIDWRLDGSLMKQWRQVIMVKLKLIWTRWWASRILFAVPIAGCVCLCLAVHSFQCLWLVLTVTYSVI